MKLMKILRSLCLAGLFFLADLPVTGLAQTVPPPQGTRDDSFDYTVFTFPIERTQALFTSPFGTLVHGGYATATDGNLRYVRLNAAGLADPSFAEPVALHNTQRRPLLILPNGKILEQHIYMTPVTQSDGSTFEYPKAWLGRANADGSPDAAFPPKDVLGGGVNAAIMLPDGRFVLAGSGWLRRLHWDGTLDTSFTPQLPILLPWFTKLELTCLASQSDGSILAGGWQTRIEEYRDFVDRISQRTYVEGVIYCYEKNGDVRWSYKYTLPQSTEERTPDNLVDNIRVGDSSVEDILVEPSGKIVIAGQFAGCLERRHPDGSLDAEFTPSIVAPPVAGRARYGKGGDWGHYEEEAKPWVLRMARQADGGLIIFGSFGLVSGSPHYNIARLYAGGHVDNAFQGYLDWPAGAIIKTQPSSREITVFIPNWHDAGLALQEDGKILAGGNLGKRIPFSNQIELGGKPYARLHNGPSVSFLDFPNTTPKNSTLTWFRAGTAPDILNATFESSPDGGATWVPLGSGTRSGTGPNWEITGVNLRGAGLLRARGQTHRGGLVEQTKSYQFPHLPIVSAPECTNLGSDSATLGAVAEMMLHSELITGRGVVYSMSVANPAIDGQNVLQESYDGPGLTGEFAVNLSSLIPETQYRFRAYATYDGGVAYSPVVTFTTLARAVPTVAIPTVSIYASTAAFLGGNVTSVGSMPLTERGVCYALTSVNANPNPGSYNVTKAVLSGAGGTGIFDLNVAGLVGGAQYSFRAYAQNSVGWGWSQVGTFTMPAAPPTVTFTNITSITSTSAFINGRVTQDNGSPVTEYGALLAPPSFVGTLVRGAPGVVEYSGSPNGTDGFTVYPTSLQPGVFHRVRLFATNSGGTGYADTSGLNTPSNNANLSALTVTGGTLTYPFNSEQTTYSCNVPLASPAIHIQPVKAHALSTIRVNSQVVTSGSTLGPFSSGKVLIQVTAEDGTVRDYDINLQSPSLAWTYTSETDVPLTANGFSANGDVYLSLGFAPSTGTTLMVVNNTSVGPSVGLEGGISLYHGRSITMSYNGINYPFVVNMYGGDGNDVVLQWAKVYPMSWGRNTAGQLGDTTTTLRGSPVTVDQSGVLVNKTIMALAAGGEHSLALCSDRTLAAWGRNADGQLGNNSNVYAYAPVEVVRTGALSGKTVVAISAGTYHSLALCSDGKVVAWGANSGGQLGDGTTTSRNVPVLVNTSSGGLVGKTVVAIAAGAGHSLALTSEGKLVMWGACAGQTTTSLPATIDSSGTIRRIWSGGDLFFASRADGTVSCWGENQYGQLGLGHTSSPASGTHGTAGSQTYPMMAPGWTHTLMLSQTGSSRTLKSFGQADNGQLGNDGSANSVWPVNVVTSGALAGRAIRALAVNSFSSLALCTDGRLAVWGDTYSNGSWGTPQAVSNLTSFSLPQGQILLSASGHAYGYHFLHLAASPVTMPTATTLAAGSVSPTSVTLNGLVNPNYHTPIVTFEYGTTTSYGAALSVTPGTLPFVANNVSVMGTLTGLQPETTYHYRIVASGIAGADMTFTTRSLANPTPAGSLDAAFDAGTAFINGLLCSIPLSDGRLLVGGTDMLKRLNADGSVDSSFALTIGGTVSCMALQPNGKILVGGSFSTVNGVSRRFLARLDAAGNLDSSTAFAPPAAIDNGVNDLLVLPDGKLMVCGQFSGGIMRLHSDGTKDTSFTAVADNRVYRMLLQPDGKLLISGDFSYVGGANRSRQARFNADGTLESTATFNAGTGANSVDCMIMQPDGKIIIAGAFSHYNGQARSRIARLNSDGSLEGTATFNVSMNDRVHSIALQADGRIVATGWFTTCNGVSTRRIARIKSNGTLDTAAEFERGTGPDGIPYLVSLKADGKVIAGGAGSFYNDARRAGVVILHNDPAISTLTVPDTAHILWTRGGSAPVFERVTFELSTNGGSTWSVLGSGTRVGTTANWQIAGLSLPTTAQVRGRGWVRGAILDTAVPYAAQPYVELATVTSPTHASVSALGTTLGGTISGDGGAVITDRGVVYAPTSVSNVPVIDGTDVVVRPADEENPFTVSTLALTPGTSYSYRAYAINSAGTSYSSAGSFTTPYNDANLSLFGLADLTGTQGSYNGTDFGTLSPAFHGNTTSYTATVPGWVDTVKVGAILSQASATVRVNGVSLPGVNTLSSTFSVPLQLNLGLNTLTVQVTAQDGSVKNYIVTVTKTGLPVLAAPASGQITTTSAALGASITSTGFTSITEKGAVISPTAINATPRLDGVGVIKLTNVSIFNDRYEMSVSGLSPGVSYSFACFATNSEGTSYTNTLTFTTLSNNASLSALALSAGMLTPVFNSATVAYQVTVPNAVPLISVTPNSVQGNSTVRVNNAEVLSGSASQTIPLQVGFNTVTLHVTAQDGVTTKIYTVTITRQSAATTAVEQWAAERGLPPSAAAPLVDADGDGVTNLMEFAFGTSPTSNSTAPMQFNGTFAGGVTLTQTGQPAVAHEPTPTGTDYRAVFVRRADHATVGLTYTVRFSANLINWQTSVVTPTVLGSDGTHQAVSVPYPLFIGGKKARFFTVGVNAAP